MRTSSLHRVAFAALFVVSAISGPLSGQSVPARTPAAVVASFANNVPVFAEHRYRMAAKIRPLLLFWVGRDNVGGARIVWRRGADATRGWELLIGSDPSRAPAHVNRWGYIREEGNDADLAMLGLMKQSDEQSLDEAKSNATQSRNGYVFKLIRTRVTQGQSNALVTTGAFSRDYTYRDLAALLSQFETPAVKSTGPRQVRVGSAKPGFLVAVADLIHDTTYAYHHSGQSGLTRRAVSYAYNGKLFDLTLLPPKLQKNERYGNRTYPTLIAADFEARTRNSDGVDRFSLVFGVDGAIEEVPVFISYQPRWWFKAELLLDETEKF